MPIGFHFPDRESSDLWLPLTIDPAAEDFTVSYLGARQGQVLRLILGQALVLAALGLVVGLPLTAVATRLLESLLFGVAPADPLTLGSVALLLAIVALLASYYPARRAGGGPDAGAAIRVAWERRCLAGLPIQ